MSVQNRMFVQTDKQYYVQGEAVDITGRTELFLPHSGGMDFVIKDNNGHQIYAVHFDLPYNHVGYQEFFPPTSIFKSTPPYYSVTGTCGGLIASTGFAYY